MKPRDVFELVLLGAIWGSSFLFMRIASPEFGPISLVAVRVGIAAAFLLIVLLLRPGMKEMQRKAGELFVLGVLNSVIGFTLFAYAVLFLTSGFAAMLNSTVPLFGAIVAYVWLREKLGRTRILGLFAGFAGVLLLVWGRISFAEGGGGFAVLAGLVASVSYAIGASFTKKHLSDTTPLVTAAGSHVAAAIVLTPLALLHWPAQAPSPRGWFSAIALGTACTGIAYILFFRLISRVGPSRTITVTYLIPAFAMLWGSVFLHEPVTARMVAACLVIFAGTALASGAAGT